MQAKVCDSKESGVREVSVAEAVELAGMGEGLVWLDIVGPLTHEDQKLLGAPPFDFHELALEDASKDDGQRSKVELYDDHFFLVMHEVSIDVSGGILSLEWE